MEVQGETHEEIGPSWEEFFSEADKMADEKNKITSLTMMKGSNHLRNVSLLPYKKAPCYGICPIQEPLKIIRCKDCGMLIKLVGYGHHMKSKHGFRHSLSASDSGDECQDFLLSPPHFPNLASTSTMDMNWLTRFEPIQNVNKLSKYSPSQSYYVETCKDLKMVLTRTPKKIINGPVLHNRNDQRESRVHQDVCDNISFTIPSHHYGTRSKTFTCRTEFTYYEEEIQEKEKFSSQILNNPQQSSGVRKRINVVVSRPPLLKTLSEHLKEYKDCVKATQEIKKIDSSEQNVNGDPNCPRNDTLCSKDQLRTDVLTKQHETPEMAVIAKLLKCPGLSVELKTNNISPISTPKPTGNESSRIQTSNTFRKYQNVEKKDVNNPEKLREYSSRELHHFRLYDESKSQGRTKKFDSSISEFDAQLQKGHCSVTANEQKFAPGIGMNMNGVTYHIHGSGGKPSKQNVSTYEALHSSNLAVESVIPNLCNDKNNLYLSEQNKQGGNIIFSHVAKKFKPIVPRKKIEPIPSYLLNSRLQSQLQPANNLPNFPCMSKERTLNRPNFWGLKQRFGTHKMQAEFLSPYPGSNRVKNIGSDVKNQMVMATSTSTKSGTIGGLSTPSLPNEPKFFIKSELNGIRFPDSNCYSIVDVIEDEGMVSGNHNQHAEFRHAGYTQSLQYQTPIDDSSNEYVYVENDDAAYGLITS